MATFNDQHYGLLDGGGSGGNSAFLALAGSAGQATAALAGLAGAAGPLREAFAQMSEGVRLISGLFSAFRPAGASPQTPGPQPGGGAVAAGEAGGGVGAAAALGGIAAAAAGAASALSGVASAVRPMVEAFAPSVVASMGRAFRDLQAVLGVGLLPIIQAATEAFRDIGGVLLPVMEGLKPVFSDLATLVGRIVSGAFGVLADVLRALTPVFKQLSENWTTSLLPIFNALVSVFKALVIPQLNIFADLMRLLQPVLQVVVTLFDGLAVAVQTFAGIFQAFRETIRAFTTGLIPDLSIKDSMSALRDAFRDLARYTILAVATLAKFVGADTFVNELRKAFAGPAKRDTTGLAAATNARTSGLTDIGRSISEAAFLASGKPGEAPEDKDAKFREQVVKSLDELSGKNLEQLLKSFADYMVEALGRAFQKPAYQAGEAAVGAAGGYIARGIHPGLGFIYDALRGG